MTEVGCRAGSVDVTYLSIPAGDHFSATGMQERLGNGFGGECDGDYRRLQRSRLHWYSPPA